MRLQAAVVVVRDLIGIAGAGLVAYGAWEIYRPAGFIVGGVLLIAGAWLHGRNVEPTASTDDEA